MSFLRIIWRNGSKHKKLSEELTLQNSKDSVNEQADLPETENDVVTFKLKYLGSIVVEKMEGENISTEAVKKILKTAKMSRKKLKRVNVEISLKGVAITDLQGNDVHRISIYRISNCSTDGTHRQVFSFVSTDEYETMECHAFLCSKRKIAETVTLTVAHAFSTAYEAWRILPQTKQFEKSIGSTEQATITIEDAKQEATEARCENNKENLAEEKLIDFDDEFLDEDRKCAKEASPFQKGQRCMASNAQWVSFEDDFMVESHRNYNSNIDLILSQ